MVYLPDGVWYDFWNGEEVAAGHHTVYAPLGRIPIFVRGGAVLPLGNERDSSTQPLSELTLNVYPAGESEWTVLEDDGLSFAYREGEVARLHVEAQARRVRVTPDYERFEPAPRELVVRVVLEERPQRVTLNGEEVAATWDEAGRAVSVRWQDDGQAREVEVA